MDQVELFEMNEFLRMGLAKCRLFLDCVNSGMANAAFALKEQN